MIRLSLGISIAVLCLLGNIALAFPLVNDTLSVISFGNSTTAPRNNVEKVYQNGKITGSGFWIHPKTTELSLLKTGPFIHLPNRRLMTVDGTKSYFSSNQGKTWDSVSIFKNDSNFLIRPERALLRTKKGTIVLAFSNDRERTQFNWSKITHDAPNAELPTYVVCSRDEGRTWDTPQLLHKEWTGAIRDIIETKDGRIVFSSMMMQHNPGHHAVVTYTSDDEGKHWTRSNIIDIGGVGDHDGATESTLEELKDGSLYMLLRTNLGYFWETRSTDHGLQWSHIKSTKIDASSSPGLMKRLKSGNLVLVWNRYYPEGKNSYPLRGGDSNFSSTPVSMQREELSIMFSKDDGQSWSSPVTIARTTEPKTQIAYPYLIEMKKGEIWLSFAFSNLRMSLLEKDFLP